MLKSLKLVYPVLATLSLAVVFQAVVMENFAIPPPPVVPLEETSGEVAELVSPAPYLNTLLILVIIFAGSLLMIHLLRYRHLLKLFVTTILFVTTWSVTFVYLVFSFEIDWIFVSLFSAVVAGAVVFGVFSTKEHINVLASSYVASACGVVFSSSLPFYTSVVLLIAVSVYDLVAVFKGHLRILGETDLSIVKGLVVNFHGLSIGLGDLFFYSVLFSFAASNLGWIPGTASLVGILMGYLLTIKLAEKRPIVPGLPLTLAIGLTASGVTYFIVP
ncbi:MAG: hypothetical protein QXF45_01530 [Candidatus Caldarchaeum sp.]